MMILDVKAKHCTHDHSAGTFEVYNVNPNVLVTMDIDCVRDKRIDSIVTRNNTVMITSGNDVYKIADPANTDVKVVTLLH